MVVERWGRFHRCCYGGWYFLMPFADKPRIITWRYTQLRGVRSVRRASSSSSRCHTSPRVTTHSPTPVLSPLADLQIVHQTRIYRIDLRENVLDFPSQKIITRDNVEISVHPMLMYRLVDPRRVCYEVRHHALQLPTPHLMLTPSPLPSRPMTWPMPWRSLCRRRCVPSLATWAWTIRWHLVRRLSVAWRFGSRTWQTTGAWRSSLSSSSRLPPHQPLRYSTYTVPLPEGHTTTLGCSPKRPSHPYATGCHAQAVGRGACAACRYCDG